MKKLFVQCKLLLSNILLTFKNLYLFNIKIKDISQKRNIVVSSYIDDFDELISINHE